MPGTKFVRTTLLATVEGNYNRRIGELQNNLREEEDGTAREKRAAAWRADAERKILQLADRLRGVEGLAPVTDSELSGWEIPYRPDRYVTRNANDLRREIDRLEKNRDKALGYVHALVTTDKDANGSEVVEVSAVDLKRIGYGV